MFTVLAVALPILFTAAIVSRKAVPTAAKSTAAAENVAEFRFVFNGDRVSLSLDHFVAEPHDRYVLRSAGAVSLPETLLYWTPSEAKDAVPAGASLVGAVVVDRPFTIPEKYTLSGSLLIYDAPHSKLLAQSSLGQR